MAFGKRSTALRGVVVGTAVALAAAVAGGTAFADGGSADAAAAKAAASQRGAHPGGQPTARALASVETPTFPLYGVNKKNFSLDLFGPNGKGGFQAPYNVDLDYSYVTDFIDVDNDKDGFGEAFWAVHKDGKVRYLWEDAQGQVQSKQVGTGYQIYGSTMLSPGNLGGGTSADLLGVDKAGVLYEYLAYPDGRVTSRIKIGAGWGQYTQIAGQGDLTGDGKADIVARDGSGVLWLYKGTGNYAAPFAPRTKIGAGWNTYNRLVSVGDLTGDGKTDLVARKSNGDLYRYSGTGSAAAPFAKPVKIGSGFQAYNLL
ncbi:FG-GAP repeat domain-containing protein [Streptomyces sp. NPDC002104]